jgi:hypothetical protein
VRFYLQQDGVPPHYHRDARAFLDEHLTNRWIGRRRLVEFPPRSPDLTPMDFFLWGHIKDKVYSRKPRIIDLKATIVRGYEAIPRAMLHVVMDSLVPRYQRCLAQQVINLNICTEYHVNTCFNIHLSPKTISNINKHDS